MRVLNTRPRHEPSRVHYWSAFEARLGELPVTATDPAARRDLVRAARDADPSSDPERLDARAHADLVHRFRYGLGPTVTGETLDEVHRSNARDALRLKREGVSSRLLGPSA